MARVQWNELEKFGPRRKTEKEIGNIEGERWPTNSAQKRNKRKM
jgi:hypothetical protein